MNLRSLPRVVQLTDPAEEPVLFGTVKLQLAIADDDTSQDARITALIVAARVMAEQYTGRTIPVRTFALFMDGWPRAQAGCADEEWWDGVREGSVAVLLGGLGAIEIPSPPLVSVTRVSTFDDSDVQTTMSPADYYVDAVSPSYPGRVALRRGSVWPVPLRTRNAVKVEYSAGYTNVPGGLATAIGMMAAWLWSQRGDVCPAGECANACGASALLFPYMTVRL